MLNWCKPVIGIDIGSRSVKLVVMSRRRDRWLLQAGLSMQLAGSAAPTIQTMLASLPRSLRTKLPQVHVTISCANVMLRKVVLPAMLDADQLDMAVSIEIEKDLPAAEYQSLFFDYSEIAARDSDQEYKAPNTRIWLAVACSSAVMQPCLATLKSAGLMPAQVAPDVLAIDGNARSDEGDRNRYLYIDAGFSGIRLYALCGGVPGYVRSHVFGSNAQACIHASDFLLSLRRALQQYRLSEMMAQPSLVFVYGGGSAMPGLSELIQQYCGCAAHVINPLVDWPVDHRPGDFSDVILSEIAPAMAVAMQGSAKGTTRW